MEYSQTWRLYHNTTLWLLKADEGALVCKIQLVLTYTSAWRKSSGTAEGIISKCIVVGFVGLLLWRRLLVWCVTVENFRNESVEGVGSTCCCSAMFTIGDLEVKGWEEDSATVWAWTLAAGKADTLCVHLLVLNRTLSNSYIHGCAMTRCIACHDW